MMGAVGQDEVEYWSEEEYWSDSEPTAQLDFENMAIEDDGVVLEVSASDVLLPKQRPLPCDSKAAVVPPPTFKMVKKMSALHIQGWINGHPLKRIFIDGGAAVNVLPISTLTKIGKSRSDMVPTKTTISSFAGDESVPMGCLVLDVTVGSVVTPTLFFIMGTKATYQALLGRCWIHSARCLPSTLHRKLWI